MLKDKLKPEIERQYFDKMLEKYHEARGAVEGARQQYEGLLAQLHSLHCVLENVAGAHGFEFEPAAQSPARSDVENLTLAAAIKRALIFRRMRLNVAQITQTIEQLVRAGEFAVPSRTDSKFVSATLTRLESAGAFDADRSVRPATWWVNDGRLKKLGRRIPTT